MGYIIHCYYDLILISVPNVTVTFHHAFLTEEALADIAQTTAGAIILCPTTICVSQPAMRRPLR